MAKSNRRSAVAATLVCLSFLTISELAHAATFTVTNTFDTGPGSLRAAISSANTTPTVASNINFSVSGTIMLASSLPAIANTSPGSLMIDGSGHTIAVDGASAFQIFSINSGATLNLQNLTIAHGSSIVGGGIINNSGGTLTVTDCTLSGNSAADGAGISNSATLTVTDSTFSGNDASIEGGGILNDLGATLTVTNSTFSSNSATNVGGGIGNAGTTTVTNSTLSGNSAGFFGGGIDDATGGTLTVTNSTFSGNTADISGGGINNNGSATLKGTILAAESTGGNCAGASTPPVTDAGYNISDDGSCGFVSPSINNSTTLNLDPAGLANNGGPTQTIALEQESEAVDFIPITACTDQSPTPQPLTTDQRGALRPDSGNPFFCDAGAYELQTSGSFILNSEKIQIARSTTAPNADMVNMALTFTDTPSPTCDADDDVLRNGITVRLFGGSCSSLTGTGLTVGLSPFVVRTVGGQSYGTSFQKSPTVPSPETVSARIVTLQTPEGDCGKWSLNLEVAGLDTPALGLGGSNPFALLLTDSDLHNFCFDITNAIVGNQIPPPAKVRRGVRR